MGYSVRRFMGYNVAMASIAALLMIGCASQSETAPPLPPDAVPPGTSLGEGTVTGRVRYGGDAPEPEVIAMRSDANCMRKHDGEARKEDLLVGPGGALRNVYVHIKSGIDRVFAPPEEPVRLDQLGCVYRPHVLGLQVGQPLLIINSDPTIHNVHSLSEGTASFNFPMSVEGQTSTRYFHAPEVMVKLKCDVHPWMSAYVGVSSHPYFDVTGDEGAFSLEGLPAGAFTLEAWHETLGAITQEIRLAEGEDLRVTLEFPE